MNPAYAAGEPRRNDRQQCGQLALLPATCRTCGPSMVRSSRELLPTAEAYALGEIGAADKRRAAYFAQFGSASVATEYESCPLEKLRPRSGQCSARSRTWARRGLAAVTRQSAFLSWQKKMADRSGRQAQHRQHLCLGRRRWPAPTAELRQHHRTHHRRLVQPDASFRVSV